MLDVAKSPDLQAALLGVRQAQREVRLNINAEARKRLNPLWTEALNGYVETRLEQRVIVRGARVKVGTRNITATAATSKKALRGGLIPANNWAPVEFGARTRTKSFTTTSRKGTRYTVTKTIGRQFRPRTKRGYVAMNAASTLITQAVRIWVRTITDAFSIWADVKAGR